MTETIVGLLGAAFIGVAGWAVQIGNRMGIVESETKSLVTLINSRFDEVNRRLENIEESISKL